MSGVQSTCAATSQCGSINGLIAGMILVFLLLLIMAIAALTFALMWKKYHTKYSSIKGISNVAMLYSIQIEFVTHFRINFHCILLFFLNGHSM